MQQAVQLRLHGDRGEQAVYLDIPRIGTLSSSGEVKRLPFSTDMHVTYTEGSSTSPLSPIFSVNRLKCTECGQTTYKRIRT